MRSATSEKSHTRHGRGCAAALCVVKHSPPERQHEPEDAEHCAEADRSKDGAKPEPGPERRTTHPVDDRGDSAADCCTEDRTGNNDLANPHRRSHRLTVTRSEVNDHRLRQRARMADDDRPTDSERCGLPTGYPLGCGFSAQTEAPSARAARLYFVPRGPSFLAAACAAGTLPLASAWRS
jgi:hypothetical protein